jgi:CspA family cold shock protein
MTNYRDTLATCQECGKQFVFTVEKQRQLAEQGQEVLPPDLCDECRQRVQYSGKLHGRIKWFDIGKGYGFIVEDNGNEVFVHRTGVSPTQNGTLPTLEEGQEVLYNVADSPKGPQAIEVTPYQN